MVRRNWKRVTRSDTSSEKTSSKLRLVPFIWVRIIHTAYRFLGKATDRTYRAIKKFGIIWCKHPCFIFELAPSFKLQTVKSTNQCSIAETLFLCWAMCQSFGRPSKLVEERKKHRCVSSSIFGIMMKDNICWRFDRVCMRQKSRILETKA